MNQVTFVIRIEGENPFKQKLTREQAEKALFLDKGISEQFGFTIASFNDGYTGTSPQGWSRTVVILN